MEEQRLYEMVNLRRQFKVRCTVSYSSLRIPDDQSCRRLPNVSGFLYTNESYERRGGWPLTDLRPTLFKT